MLRDLRYAWRNALRRPGRTIVDVLTLALGIGATTAVFSIGRSVLLKPLPYPQPEGLVAVWERNLSGGDMRVAAPNFLDWRARSRALPQMAAYANGPTTVLGGDEPVRVDVADVSDGFFDVLRVRPAKGRDFIAEETTPGGPGAAIVSQEFWRDRLGSVRDLSDRTLRIGSSLYRVVGVAPSGFHFPGATAVWIPAHPDAADGRNSHNWSVIARLHEGDDVSAADRELNAIESDLKQQFGSGVNAVGVNVRSLRDDLVGSAKRPLLMLLGAALLVLLVSCVNLASGALASGNERLTEVMIRSSLGATQRRLLRQLFTESLLLAGLGELVGLALAGLSLRVILALAPPDTLPRIEGIQVDQWGLLFATCAAVTSAVLVGLVPGVRVASHEHNLMARALRREPRDNSWSMLIAAETGMTLLLLVGAGLLFDSLRQVLSVNPGFVAQDVATIAVSLPTAQYPNDTAIAAFYRSAVPEVGAITGVRSVGLVSQPPLGGRTLGGAFDMEGRASQMGYAEYRVADSSYFRVLQIPLLAGRLFGTDDRAGAPDVAVVSQSLADRYWPGTSPIGERVRGLTNDDFVYGDMRWVTIVGVVGDVHDVGLTVPAVPTIYVDAQQRPYRARDAVIVLSTRLEPATLIDVLRLRLHQRYPEVPLELGSMDDRVARSLASRRFLTLLLTLFAGVALALAAVGIYGVVSLRITHRTREIGIRIALGADPRHVRNSLVERSVGVVALGMGLGIVASLPLNAVMRGLIFGVSPADPSNTVRVALILLAVSAAAAYLPARRATRVDPVRALRSE